MIKLKTKKKLKRGDVVRLKPGMVIYHHWTPEEIATGTGFQGENGNMRFAPGKGCAILLREATTVLVTSLRNVPWAGWQERPVGLTSGVITSGPHTGRRVEFTFRVR